jgi:hypothetical protein
MPRKQRKMQRKQRKKIECYIDPKTGNVGGIDSESLRILRNRSRTRRYYNALVDRDTGKRTELRDKALKEAKNNGTVISRSAYIGRELVYADTGKKLTKKELDELGEEGVKKAKELKRICTCSKYKREKSKARNAQRNSLQAPRVDSTASAPAVTSSFSLPHMSMHDGAPGSIPMFTPSALPMSYVPRPMFTPSASPMSCVPRPMFTPSALPMSCVPRPMFMPSAPGSMPSSLCEAIPVMATGRSAHSPTLFFRGVREKSGDAASGEHASVLSDAASCGSQPIATVQ